MILEVADATRVRQYESSWLSAIRKLAETGLWEIGRLSVVAPTTAILRIRQVTFLTGLGTCNPSLAEKGEFGDHIPNPSTMPQSAMLSQAFPGRVLTEILFAQTSATTSVTANAVRRGSIHRTKVLRFQP